MWALGACFFLWNTAGGSSSNPGDALSRIASVVKADLARAYFQQKVQKPPKLKLRETYRMVLEIDRKGERSGVFGNSNHSYVFNGEGIFRVDGNAKSSSRDFFLQNVTELQSEEGPVLFQNYFYRQSDSQKLWFTVICYRKGYCQVLVSAEEGKNGFNLQIDTGTAPFDVRFFLDEEELLLIIVKDPCLVYRWTGTYFDQQDVLDTTGARSVAAFRRGKNSVFVVAQNLGLQKVHSRVYVRKDKKMELIQLLPTSNALKAEPFTLKNGEDFLDLVFVVNEMTSSSIYWWNGKELSLWKSVDDILGNGIVHVDHVFSETFLFFSNKNELRVYRSTPLDFDPVLILSFDSNVIDLDLKEDTGGFPLLVVLTGSNSDPFLKVVVIPMEMDYLPPAENQKRENDQTLQCLKQLEERLTKRHMKLSQARKKARFLSSVKHPVPVAFLSAEKSAVSKSDVEHLIIEPLDVKSDKTLTEISGEIARLKSLIEYDLGVLNGSYPNDKIYTVRGETKLGKLKVNRISVEKLGGKSFRPEKFLSLTKNQNLGRTKAGKSSAKDLKVLSVRGIDVKDILIKNGRRQEIIIGEQTVKSLKAGNVRFGEGGKINGIFFSDLVKREDSENTVTGKKIFKKFKTQNLVVEKINGVASQDWSSKILPGFKNKTEQDAHLDFSQLNVGNLKVSYMNDIPWEDIEDSLLLLGKNNFLSGNLSCTGKTKVGTLRAGKLNGIPPEEFLTATTDQKLDCGLMGPSAEVIQLKPKSINGLHDGRLKEIFETDQVFRDAAEGTLRENITVSNLVFKNVANLSGRLIDFETLRNIFYSKTGTQEIRTPVHLKKTVTVRESLKPEKIGGKAFDSLSFVDESTVIRPESIFEKATVKGNVSVSQDALRNVDLRDVVSSSAKSVGENTVSEGKKSVCSLSAKRLRSRLVNGTGTSFIFSQRNNYDIEEIIVHGNASVLDKTEVGELCDVPFDEKISNLVLTHDSSLLEYGNHSSLLVKDLDVERLNDLAISSGGGGESMIDLNFEGNLKTPEIVAGTVNGVEFDRYARLVIQKNDSRLPIRGRKIFLEKVGVFGDLNGTIDGYNVVDFEKRALSKTKGQNVTAVYRVEDADANALFAETVDGIETDNLIFQDDLNVPKIDSDLVFNNLIVAGNVRSLDFKDGCDLNKIVEKNLEAVQNFGSLDVKEDLIWRKSESGDLSRLFSNAVTSHKDEEIVTGRIVFRGDVFADSVATKFHVNDIDLKSVADKALYRSSPKQEMPNGVVFKGNLSVGNVLVLKNSIVDHIDKVDILDFDSKIVRKDADVVIGGRKEFRNGFSAERLRSDRINGVSTKGIIFYDDTKTMPSTTFEALKISESLEVEKVDGVDLEDLSSKRWSKAKDETLLENVTVKGKVYVLGDAEISAINDVVIESAVPLEGENPKTIFGNVQFQNAISVDGKIDLEKIDGRELASIKRQSFVKDEKVNISGKVVFSEEIEIDGEVEISKEVNGEGAEDLVNLITDVPQRKKIEKILEKGKHISSFSILMHLEEVSAFDLDYSQILGSDLVDNGYSVEIRIEGFKRDSCGLPEECLCPVQTKVSVSPEEKLSVDKDFPRKFKFFDRGSELEATVETSTVSYDPRCTRAEKGETVVTWNSSKSSGKKKLGDGYVDDVKFFRLGDSVYLVVSYSSLPEGLATVVYEVTTSDEKVTEVERVPDSRAFEVFWTSEGVVMVTGNAAEDSLGIRRFVESKNQFTLLKIVPTHGVTAVKSTRHKKEIFIFVLQKRSWPLLILKYDPNEDNYRVQQKRDTAETDLRADFLSVALLSTSELKNGDEDGDLFMGIVLSDDSFGLFKYKHIEGFVETLIQEQENVKLLQPFRMGSAQYLLAASSSTSSKLYKFVKQGTPVR